MNRVRISSRTVIRRVSVRLVPFLAGCARQPIYLALRVFPDRAAWLRDVDWLWQPLYGRHFLQGIYSRGLDPYRLSTNPYEASKYRHALDAIGGRVFERALEVGCSEGVFTEMLAGCCHSLIAIDISELAVERATARLRHLGNVEVRRATIPFEVPEGPFDLVVCSDVLYFLPRDVLARFSALLRDRVMPGGTLLVLHYLGDIGMPISGNHVHDYVVDHLGFDVAYDETVANVGHANAGYRVTRLIKPSAMPASPRPNTPVD